MVLINKDLHLQYLTDTLGCEPTYGDREFDINQHCKTNKHRLSGEILGNDTNKYTGICMHMNHYVDTSDCMVHQRHM